MRKFKNYFNARDEAVAAVVDAPLVDGHPGDEPRGLQDEDGGDGDGAGDAERVNGRQNLKVAKLFNYSEMDQTILSRRPGPGVAMGFTQPKVNLFNHHPFVYEVQYSLGHRVVKKVL